MINVILLKFIKFYQYVISPLYQPCCRFDPTCSNYAHQAIKKYKMIGVILSIYRIIRCNPIGGYGFDPVPDNLDKYFKMKRKINESRS